MIYLDLALVALAAAGLGVWIGHRIAQDPFDRCAARALRLEARARARDRQRRQRDAARLARAQLSVDEQRRRESLRQQLRQRLRHR